MLRFARAGANWSILRLHPAASVAPYVNTMHFCSGVGRFLAGLLGAQFAGTAGLLWAFYVSAIPHSHFTPPSLLTPPGLLSQTASALALGVSAALCVSALALGDQPVGMPKKAETQAGSKAAGTASSGGAAAAPDATTFVWTLALFVFLIMGAQNSFQYLVTSYAVAASPCGGLHPHALHLHQVTPSEELCHPSGRWSLRRPRLRRCFRQIMAGPSRLVGWWPFRSRSDQRSKSLHSHLRVSTTTPAEWQCANGGPLFGSSQAVLSSLNLIFCSLLCSVLAFTAIVAAPASSVALSSGSVLLGVGLASIFPSAINFAKVTC